MTKRSNSPLFGNSDATPGPYQVCNDWVFNICEALSSIHKNVKIRKFFASPEKLVKCSYNSFALTPRYEMTTSVRFSLSYNLLNVILSPSKFVYSIENLHCCHGLHRDVNCSR